MQAQSGLPRRASCRCRGRRPASPSALNRVSLARSHLSQAAWPAMEAGSARLHADRIRRRATPDRCNATAASAASRRCVDLRGSSPTSFRRSPYPFGDDHSGHRVFEPGDPARPAGYGQTSPTLGRLDRSCRLLAPRIVARSREKWFTATLGKQRVGSSASADCRAPADWQTVLLPRSGPAGGRCNRVPARRRRPRLDHAAPDRLALPDVLSGVGRSSKPAR